MPDIFSFSHLPIFPAIPILDYVPMLQHGLCRGVRWIKKYACGKRVATAEAYRKIPGIASLWGEIARSFLHPTTSQEKRKRQILAPYPAGKRPKRLPGSLQEDRQG